MIICNIICLYVVDEDLIKVKKWLQFNVEPMSEVLKKWQETCKIRREYLLSVYININDILQEWPIFKQSFGHSLVVLNFFIIVIIFDCTI